MNRSRSFSFGAALAMFLSLAMSSFAQGTAFNYQGQLSDNGSPANGTYDFRFWVYDSTNNPGVLIAGPITNSTVSVANGLFNVALDFGTNVFTGPDRWLQMAVRTNGALTFTNLSPRQEIVAVPYAIFANSASNLVGALPAAQLSGTLPASAFSGYTNTVALTNGANLFAGSFAGNGGGVTNVNVTNLTGVLANSQLPANTAYVNSNQTFTAANNFSGTNFFSGPNTFTNLYGNSFSGSFFGNGLVGWIATNGIAVQAEIDHGYLLTNAQITTVTLPSNAVPGDIVRISGAGSAGWKVAQNAGQSVLGNFINYGGAWLQNSTFANWNDVVCSSDGSIVAATVLGGNIYVSTDGGSTWTAKDSSRQWQAVAMSSDGSKMLAAVTNGGSLYRSTDYGSTWSAYSGTAVSSWSCVASSADGNRLYAAVAGAYIYTNSGTLWIAGGAPTANWTAIACSADGIIAAASIRNGNIYVTANGGRTWSIATGTATKLWTSLAVSANGARMAGVVYGGGIYVSTNSGSSFVLSSAPTANWSAIASSSDGARLVAAVQGGGIYTSPDWGTTWTQQTNAPTAAGWSSVASSASGNHLVAVIHNTVSGGTYTSSSTVQTVTTTAGTAGYLTGGQSSAVELQYIGNNQWMPVSSAGTIWAY